jgi:hypothetical protein
VGQLGGVFGEIPIGGLQVSPAAPELFGRLIDLGVTS